MASDASIFYNRLKNAAAHGRMSVQRRRHIELWRKQFRKSAEIGRQIENQIEQHMKNGMDNKNPYQQGQIQQKAARNKMKAVAVESREKIAHKVEIIKKKIKDTEAPDIKCDEDQCKELIESSKAQLETLKKYLDTQEEVYTQELQQYNQAQWVRKFENEQKINTSTKCNDDRENLKHRSEKLVIKKKFTTIDCTDKEISASLDCSNLNGEQVQSLIEARQQHFSTYEKRIDELNEQYTRRSSDLEQHHKDVMRNADQASANDNLNADEVYRLEIIVNDYTQAGRVRSETIDRLRIELPERKLATLASKFDAVVETQYYREKRRQLLQSFQKSVSEADEELKRQLVTSEEKLLKQCSAKAKMREAIHDRKVRGKIMARMRERYAERQAAEKEMLKVAHARLEAQKLAQQLKQDEYRRQQNQLLAMYRSQLEQERQAQEASVALAREHIEAEQKRVAVTNAQRVAYRQTLEQEKAEEKAARVADEEMRKADLEYRLEQLRATVAIEVERDPARLLQLTRSMAQETQHLHELFPVNGYNMDKLLADNRTRLMLALSDSGINVGNSIYGRHMVLAQRPAIIPRKDMQNTFVIGDETRQG